MICPNIHIKEVKDNFNEMVEALGGRPLTDEEFKSSELRNQRTGLDYSAMNAAYRSYHRNNGNMLDKAPNGKDSVLFNSLLNYFGGDRAKAIRAKSNVYTDQFFNWFGDWTGALNDTKYKLIDVNSEINWKYFELLLDKYHNKQPDSMFSHGRYTLSTRPENHFSDEKNTLNHIKFVTQSMLNLFEGKYDMDLPFVSEARSSLENQKDLMILAAMFHDAAKPYRHGDIHGWESADILRDIIGVDYNNRLAEWAIRHHMPMPFSHKAEFSLSNPEAIEVAKNIARDARRVGIDANTAINAFVLINAADVINGRELNVDDNWAKKAGEEGLKKYGGDISVKNVLSVELKEKVALLKKAFDEIKDEDFGNAVYNYSHQERFDYQAFPEGGREDKKLPYLNNTEYNNIYKKANPYSSKISVANVAPDYDSADAEGPGAMFAIFEGDKYIGSIAINANYKSKNQFKTWGEKGTNYVSLSSVGDAVEIEKEFRGKGYGKAAYFEFAKQMANMGYVLRSAPAKSRTEASTRVWKSLVRDGYAKEAGDRYEFINSSLDNTSSKAVDENGEPLVVYRIDTSDFLVFDKNKLETTRLDTYGIGFYFSNDLESVKRIYAEKGRNPRQFYLNMGDFDTHEYDEGLLYGELQKDRLITFNNAGDDFYKEYIVRNPNQIKHVENLGDWSTEDNDIYHESFDLINTSMFTKDPFLKLAYEARMKDNKHMSIEEAFDYISTTEIGRSVVLLLNYVAKSKGKSLIPKNLTIRVVSGIAMPYTAGPKLQGHRASYDADTNTIYIDSDAYYENSSAANVLLHEIMHAITLGLLENDSEARAKLENVLDVYRKAYPNQYFSADPHSLAEFVADIWTNPLTIKRLKEIPYKTESLFDRIINILKQLFKTFFKEDTLFAEASKILVELLESTPADRKGTAGIYFATNPTTAQIKKEYDDISNKIRSLFSELYKRFDKMPNKSNTRRKTLTEIFKTIQRLKQELADKAIEIALETAAEQLGVINQQTGAPQSSDNLYAWFVNQEAKDKPYENVTPQLIQDIYKHLIGFYREVLATIPDGASMMLNPTTRLNRLDVLSQLDIIENMWKHAVEMIGEREIDNMIDNFTGLAIPQEQKENMKVVYRDWLHKNWFYGDIVGFTSLFTSYGQSPNPIVKITFHLTQYAEQKTQEELIAKAVPILEKFQSVNTTASWVKPGWQKIFQEVNKDGIPTGKWVRDINYGQYEQDLNEFVQELNDDFDARYGHHYIYDELGMPKNSVTGEYAEDEEWIGGIMPHYVEYLQDLYIWKTQHATLRYTLLYYLERLSRPYDEVSYPQGHGLSLKTLQRYENVQNIINYYLGLCTGEDGIPHPERPKDKGGLTDYERIELDKAKQELKDISSPFEADGTPKVDEEYQMAMEILTWLKYVSNILKGFDYDYAAFDKALNEATALSQLLNDPSILANFYKYNSDILIDPDFLESIFGVSENISSANIIIKQIHLKCLENLTKIKDNLYTRDIEPFRNNVLFWMNYRQLVQDVMDNKQYDRIVDPIEDLEDVADYYEVPYVDSNGNMYDIFGAVATNTTPRTQIMTWLGYIVNYYKDIAVLNNGIIPGVDDQYGNPIIFQGSDMEIANQVKATLFKYEATWWDKNGKMHTKMRPLPMFTVLLPKDDKYIVHVPTDRFAKPKQSILTNPLFDEKSGIAEQPLRSIYNNTKAYNKVMKNKLTRELYEDCIQCMQKMQKVMGFNNKTFNYKLPMLNADTSALLSRADIKSILKSSTEIQNDDTDMRNVDAGIKTADGSVAFDIPLRLLLDLKDMRNLSSDVVQSVILYIQMAYNYRNKKAISDTILTIHDNLTENVRNRTATDYDRFSDNPTNMDQAIDDENSLKQYEAMMDSTLYGMDTGKSSKAHKEPTKGEIFARKAGNSIVRFEAVATLGLNLLSIFAGGYDSISKMLRESILNRYMSIVDLTKSIIYVLLHLPKVVANIGNPLANCKIVALMLLNKLSKDYGKVVDNLNHNRVIKTLNNLLMGGYSMFDYFSNMILLRAHYRNVRFYDGDVIPKGFYTAYEMRQAFKAAGKSWKEGALAHTLCKTSLWSVYEFDEHKAVVKDNYISEAEKAKADAGGVGLKWSDFVTDRVKTDIMTKSLQRSALYNGMAPDNDRARYLKTIWGKAIFAMRNWYQMVLQRALIGTDDTSVRKVADTNKESIRFGKTFFKPGKKVESRTEEQSYNRMGWNFETGAPQEEIVKSMFRGVIKMLRMSKAAISFKFGDFKNIKLSNVEKYGIRGFITQLLYLELLFYSFIPIMNMAQQVPMPTNKKDAELSISNILRDAKNLFILWWANAHIRAYESNKAEVNPLEPKAFIKTSSALMGALDHQTALLDMAEEGAGMSTHTLDEVISTGSKYKYYTRGERYVYQSVGPLNNMVTSLTIPGVKYNTQWYMNMYGDAYRQKGYDFRIGSGSKLNSNRPKVKRPEIKRPKIKRHKIKRPRR